MEPPQRSLTAQAEALSLPPRPRPPTPTRRVFRQLWGGLRSLGRLALAPLDAMRRWRVATEGAGPLAEGRPELLLASLRAGLREAGARRTVHPQAAEIAARALEFGALRVQDVMVPRGRIQALPRDVAPTALRRVLLEGGHSRLPIYEGTLDNIVGVLVAKDVLALAWEHALIILEDLLQPPYFAPESMHAADLLGELQRRRLHFAVVVDELGGTAGIVTLEDLLEELVGDIYGEHDATAPERIHHEADGTVTLEGLMPVREANRELSLGLPESETFTTVGGLCVSMAGRIPEPGQQLEVGEGVVLEVVEASPRLVKRVRLQRGARLRSAPHPRAGANLPPAL